MGAVTVHGARERVAAMRQNRSCRQRPAGAALGKGNRRRSVRGLPMATIHAVRVRARLVPHDQWQSSGLSAITLNTIGGSAVLVGSADPRCEGVVLGDTFKP